MTIQPLVNYISKSLDLSVDEVKLLKHFFKTSDFSKGAILEKENAVAQNLYFINHGFLRTFSNQDGVEITTQIVGENNLMTAFDSFVSGRVSKESVQCISNCELLYISKSDYEMVTRESAIWGAFCKKVYEKVIMFNQQRTSDLLTLSAEKRYLKLLSEQPEIIRNVPIQYIASYIGIKAESLSRIRKKIVS